MKNVNRTFPLLLTALLLLCGSLAFGQERTLQTERDGFKWYELKQDGYCGAQSIDGTTLIPLSRKYTCIFYLTHGGGYFSFHKNNSSTYEGCCDKNGKEIIAPERGYTDVFYYGDDGYIKVEKNGLVGLCDLNGREIIAPERGYTRVLYYGDEDYIIVKKNDLEGICDLNGREIIAPERGYTDVFYYGDDGYIEVEKNGLKGVCNLNGREIVAPKYERLTLLDGEFEYENSQGKWISTGIKYDGKTDAYANASSSSSSSYSNNSSSSSNGARSVPQQPYSVLFNIYDTYQSSNAGSSNNGGSPQSDKYVKTVRALKLAYSSYHGSVTSTSYENLDIYQSSDGVYRVKVGSNAPWRFHNNTHSTYLGVNVSGYQYWTSEATVYSVEYYYYFNM